MQRLQLPIESSKTASACFKKNVIPGGEERISREIETSRTLHNIRERSSRTRNAPEHVENFVVTESLPRLTTKDPKSMCVSCIDVMDHFISEFDRRFLQDNIDVWMTVDYLVPENKDFLCATKLKPLLDDYSCCISK